MKTKPFSPAPQARRQLKRYYADLSEGKHNGPLPPPEHLVLRSSSIHSMGCYTTKALKKGAVVAEYTGPHLTIPVADELYEKSPRTYLFGLADGKHVIDGASIAAFINHCCEPNCEVDEVKGRVWITAIRDIASGEELTYDYNLYDGELDDFSRCHCGADKCRGSMYSKKEIARRMKKKAKKSTKKPVAKKKKSAAGRKAR